MVTLEKYIMRRAGDRDEAGRREGARFSRERSRGTRETGAEAAANELLDTLQRAEAKQVAAWVRQQHKGVDNELAFAASRLRDSLGRSPSISLAGCRTNTQASTWPCRPSSLRVDGQDSSGMLQSRNRKLRETPSGPQDSVVDLPRVDEPGSSGGHVDDFVKRAREAITAQELNADVVEYYLLPSSAIGSEDRTVGDWEVFNVLTIDVGMELSEKDKKLICTKYGTGSEGRIDVDAFMASLFPVARSNSRSDADTAGMQADPSSPTSVDRVGTTAKHSSIPSPEGASLSESPHLADVRCGRARTSVVPGGNKQAGQNHNQPLGGDANDGRSHPIASERLSWAANPNHDVHILQVASESARAENGLIDQHPRDKDSSETRRSSNKDSRGITLEEENTRLRSELAMFDLGFFEEVEDLKYSYAKLKREAETLARGKVPEGLASLQLPEDVEESWGRAVDMPHKAINCRGASSKQLPAESVGSPSRGMHASRLAKRWCNLMDRDEQADGPLCGARFTPRKEQDSSRLGLGGKDSRREVLGLGTGVVAAHERKLAREVLSGRMSSLKSLRKYAKRLETSGSGFLSEDQVLFVLKDSGYALDADDVSVLRTGLGMDADGKVDFAEFMSMCEDFASSQEWYVPASTVPAPFVSKAILGHVNVAKPNANSPIPEAMFLNNGVPPHFEDSVHLGPAQSLFLGGTAYGDKKFLKAPKTSDEVVAELKDQLSLLDVDRLAWSSSRGEGCDVGSTINIKFMRRDPMSSGLLSARELGLALEDLGVTLQADEVMTLARRFPPPGERQSGGHGHDADDRISDLDRVMAEYAPLVRLIVDYLAKASGVGIKAGGRGTLSPQSKWYNRMPDLASRLGHYLDDGGITDGVGRTRQRFRDFDVDNEGYLGRREFIRALTLSLSSTCMNEEQPNLGFPLGGLISEVEAEQLMDILNHRRDGRVFWKDFMEFFGSGVDRRDSGGSARRWCQVDGDIGRKLVKSMEDRGGPLAKRAWVNTLFRRFQDADDDHTGALDKVRFSRCLRGMQTGLTTEEVQRLFASLQDEEGARFGALIDFLRSKNNEWFQAERGIAEKVNRTSDQYQTNPLPEELEKRSANGDQRFAKIVQAMGMDVPARRAWLNRMRQRFMNLDAFRVGIMGASDLLQALRDGGCYLTLEEEAKLIDTLETTDSARCDIEGGVSYRELLSFCARYAGKWKRFREALRIQAKTPSDVRRMFQSMDEDGDGYLSRQEFNVALHRLGLGIIAREEQEALMDALDADKSGRIRFADFESLMQEDPRHKSDVELAEEFCTGLEEAVGGVPRTILGTLREWFLKADTQMRGTLDKTQFRGAFASLPGTEGLVDDEVERLWDLLDVEDDGRVSYRSLLGLVVKHMTNWTERLPQVVSELSFLLRHNEFGLEACVENLSRRIDIADSLGTGRLSPSVLGRCLRNVGLELTPGDLREMVKAMDIHGDDRIPTDQILEFLREEARAASKSGAVALSKANGKLDAAFCDAVRTLANEERPNEREIDTIWRQKTKPWRERIKRVFDRRLDLDGDGFLTERDLLECLPEMGIDADLQGVRMLLRAMDPRKSSLGKASFQDFVEFITKGETGRDINEDATDEISPSKSSSSWTRPELWQQVRIDLGLASPSGLSAHSPITGADAMRVFARLDPQDRGSLPLGKIKAGLQGLGLSVGKIARGTWLQLADSLNQDANGCIFYQDFVDNLLLNLSGTRERLFSMRSPTTARRQWTPKESSGARRLVSRALDGRGPVPLQHEVSETAERKISPLRDGWGTNDSDRPRCAYPSAYRPKHRDSRTRSVSWENQRGVEVSKPFSNVTSRTRQGPTGARVLRHKPADGAERRRISETSRPPDRHDFAIARARATILEDLEKEHGTEKARGEALRTALRREDLTRRGTLSKGELWKALDSVGVRMTFTQVSDLFDHFDKTRSGTIDHKRFADFVLREAATPRNNPDSATKRLDISTIQALAAQAPAVVSLRRQLEERLVRVPEPVMQGMEFKRLLQNTGLDLAPEKVAHLRQRCGDQSGQVNTLALLAYLEDLNRETEVGYNTVHGERGNVLPPDTVLKGRAHGRLGRKTK